jgi:CHAT domain-containing protein
LAADRPLEAQERFETALDVAQSLGAGVEKARAWIGLGALEAECGQWQAALQHYQEAQALTSEMGAAELNITAWIKIGDLHRRQKLWEPAAEAYRSAVVGIEALRATVMVPDERISFLDQWTPAYHRLQECLIAMGQIEEAWRVLERSRARALREALKMDPALDQGSLSPAEEQEREALTQKVTLASLELRNLWARSTPPPERIEDTRQRLNQTRRALEDFEQRIASQRPGIGSNGPDPSRLALDEAAHCDPSGNSVFLEYSIGSEASHLFVLRTEPSNDGIADKPRLRISAIPIPSTLGDLGPTVDTLRRRIQNRHLRLPIPEAVELYQQLLEPAAELLAGCKHVCILPDAFLCDVPFHALFNPTTQRYLIEEQSVSYAPSLATLIEVRRQAEGTRAQPAQEDRGILVMANPMRHTNKPDGPALLGPFQEIPGTEEQARAIAGLFGDSSALYLGDDATEAEVRRLAGQFRFLHFATHGIYDAQFPMSSGLFLAHSTSEEGDDGYWEAREIVQTPLQAEMVVLAACETGRGRIHLGEGIWGLSWALLKAGSAANVLSQWAVADSSTADLMTEFYQRLRPASRDHVTRSKAEALRQAQLTLLRNPRHQHPFYWAPFVLIGDWR